MKLQYKTKQRNWQLLFATFGIFGSSIAWLAVFTPPPYLSNPVFWISYSALALFAALWAIHAGDDSDKFRLSFALWATALLVMLPFAYSVSILPTVMYGMVGGFYVGFGALAAITLAGRGINHIRHKGANPEGNVVNPP